jgi:hypothetical protein
MVLLIYHYDKHNTNEEQFLNQEIRLDLGFFPKPNTYVKLRQLGFSCNSRGGSVHLSFPDTHTDNVSYEEIDKVNIWEMEGFVFSARYGENDENGAYLGSSDHYDLNLNLGVMDTQKDFFTIIVNGRRADVESTTLNNLSSISIVLEMSHHNHHT